MFPAITRYAAQKALNDIAENGISDPIDWYVFNAGFKRGEQKVYFNAYSVKPHIYRPIWLAPVASQSSIPEITESV